MNEVNLKLEALEKAYGILGDGFEKLKSTVVAVAPFVGHRPGCSYFNMPSRVYTQCQCKHLVELHETLAMIVGHSR